MSWAVALNPNNEGNQYISSIDINSQSGNSNPVWNLKFKLSAGNEVSGFYRIAAESIGNVPTNRILLAADLSEIRFYRGTSPKTFSLSGASINDIFEFDSDGTQLECLVNGASQGFISGATGVTLLNFGANFGNYSNMELEYVDYTTTDDANLNRNYDATGSDHNSLILSDITGNDAGGGSFNNMTTANWINLGGNDFEIVGDIPVSVILSSNIEYLENNEIQGDIPITVALNSGIEYLENYEIVGDIPTSVLPNSQFEYIENYDLAGSIPISVTPASQFEFDSGFSIVGNIPISISLQSGFEYTEHYEIDGSIPIAVVPSSVFEFTESYSIGGSIPVNITPSSIFEFVNGDQVFYYRQVVQTSSQKTVISTSSAKTVIKVV